MEHGSSKEMLHVASLLCEDLVLPYTATPPHPLSLTSLLPSPEASRVPHGAKATLVTTPACRASTGPGTRASPDTE